MKRPFITFSFILFTFLLFASTVGAQSIHDGFDPNADRAVRVVVVQPDGNILIGGDFTMVHGVVRNHIARLRPDGTVDTEFNPDANAAVHSIVVQSDGKVLVGGSFTTINGETRNHIARLNADSGLPDSFNPNAGCFPAVVCSVDTIALDHGRIPKVFVGGSFTTMGPRAETRNHIARLEPDGRLIEDFDPNANDRVRVIVREANGDILIGGDFTTLDHGGVAVTRNHIARLSAGGTLDMRFDPNANNVVRSVAVQADGKVLVGGSFMSVRRETSIGGLAVKYIARLDAVTGTGDRTFRPNANGAVNSIVVQSDGRVLVGGSFHGAGSIGGQKRNFIARLDAITAEADSFDPDANREVYSIAVQPDGKVLAGGEFFNIGVDALTRKCIARLEVDGSIDRTLGFNIRRRRPSLGDAIFATATQPDGKLLIGGSFTNVLGVDRNKIARLNLDGTLDTDFNPNVNDTVRSIVVQPGGNILIGGDFTMVTSGSSTVTRNHIARLDPNGMLDMDFNPNANRTVRSIAVQSNGYILIGGDFTTLTPGRMMVNRRRIARLTENGSVDDGFDPSASGTVRAIALEANGNILVGGDFMFFGLGRSMVSRNHIARLMPDGSVDPVFDPNANRPVLSIAVQWDGKVLAGGSFRSLKREPTIGRLRFNYISRLDAVTGDGDRTFHGDANGEVYSIVVESNRRLLVGGHFTQIGGARRNRIARLIGALGIADSFDPNASDDVLSIAVQADGKALAGGAFSFIGGQFRPLFVRLSSDTAALSNVAMTPTTITWTRAGSAPQLIRATFEYSWDNGVSYFPLGDAVPTTTSRSSIYSRTGIRLPIGRNILIRARGHFPGGSSNGSESVTEQVQIALLPLRAIPNLIQNPSFEDIPPCSTPTTPPCTGEGLMPSNWFPVPSDKTPDTYSEDGSYGFWPDHGQNFTGATAQGVGIRWIAGAHGNRFPAEAFAQEMASPLIPGQQYTLTAYLRMAHRSDVQHPGIYEIELRDSASSFGFRAIRLGPLAPPIETEEWQLRTLIFTVPLAAATYRILVFRPHATVDEGMNDTYPGIDNVALVVSSPAVANVTVGGRTLACGRKSSEEVANRSSTLSFGLPRLMQSTEILSDGLKVRSSKEVGVEVN